RTKEDQHLSKHASRELALSVVPALVLALFLGYSYLSVTKPEPVEDPSLALLSFDAADAFSFDFDTGLEEPLASFDNDIGLITDEPEPAAAATAAEETPDEITENPRKPAPKAFWIFVGVIAAIMAIFYAFFTIQRLEVFKQMIGSFFPLAILVLAVLGSIVLGFATPAEAAAMGAFGGMVLAILYRRFNFKTLQESVHLTAKTTAMVCWLFVGSSIFAAAFALLGGQELINAWVISMDLSPIQFLIMAQVLIFMLGWPLEWTEIIVIFMPIFIPLVHHFGIDPLFFGLLVALNLQTSFLTPPVAMSAFYLKGVAPAHVSLNQIF